jgi:hypothetical protein
VQLEELGKLKKIYLIGTRISDLPAYSIVPQLTTLLRSTDFLQQQFLVICVLKKYDSPSYKEAH